jgi:hypothetical protein
MKRFWLILLSLGLVMAFSVSAFAVDVKVSGEFYVAGMYLNKTTVADPLQQNVGYPFSYSYPNPYYNPNIPAYGPAYFPHAVNKANPSTAFFYQRLRVGTDFIVSPSLKLVTRFDAMERIWGGQRSTPGTSEVLSAGTRAESENIAFDLCYIDYTSPIGKFIVGYYKDYNWGTIFGNKYGTNGRSNGQIAYVVPVGPIYVSVNMVKENDNSLSAVTTGTTTTDQDYDSYRVAGTYRGKDLEAGLLFLWERDARQKAAGLSAYNIDAYLGNQYALTPYVKAKIGPVDLMAEFAYGFGDAVKFENGSTAMANIGIGSISAFVDATANFGMFTVGGAFAYLSGDDPATKDKLEGSGLLAVNTGGLDWNPCLIMFNNDITYWAGGIQGNGYWPANATTKLDGPMTNAWFFQGRVGINPTPQLSAMLSVSYATADKKPAFYTSVAPTLSYVQGSGGTYGTEVDITATYKITNNLSYMLGAGYLFTGDYFKGYDQIVYSTFGGTQPKIVDNFIVINKLTLNF